MFYLVGQKNVNYLVTTLLLWLTVHFEVQLVVKNIAAIDDKHVKVLRNWSCVPSLYSGRNAKRMIKRKKLNTLL